MERRNFFKSLIAAGMVVAAPRILTDNVEAIEIPKGETVIIKESVGIPTSQIYRGSIKHKDKVIANFNEVSMNISSERELIEFYDNYDDSLGFIGFKGIQQKIARLKSTITLYAMNINWGLSNAAFQSGDLVEICVTTETDGEINACGYITEMQVSYDFMEPIFYIWEINVSGEIHTTIKKGEF